MSRHVIYVPKGADGPSGGDYEIIWDNDAGTLEGDARSDVSHWKARIHNEGLPLNHSDHERILFLNNPLHDPRDFLWLLPWKMWKEPLRSTLPAILRDAEPTPATRPQPPRIIGENDAEREAMEGVEFVW